jgi:hypothetical protein
LVIHCKKLDPQEDFLLLQKDYFRNAAMIGGVTMKTWELLYALKMTI